MAEKTSSADGKEAGDALPLRPAIASSLRSFGEQSPRSGPAKVVSISDKPESITSSPILSSLDSSTPKQFSAGVAKRLTGRPSSGSPRGSVSMEELPAAALPMPSSGHSHGHKPHSHDKLLTQVSEWLQAEKAKRAARKSKKTHGASEEVAPDAAVPRERSASQSSESSVMSLEKLQRILEDNMGAFGHEALPAGDSSPYLAPRPVARRKSSTRALALTRTMSSDTEYQDGDVVVPSCEEVLDNSKTLSYSGGAAVTEKEEAASSAREEKERKAWSVFKNEILRLAHTLRLKGWRRVPLDRGDDLEVERLSGALTNAVYVVSPPVHLPPLATSTTSTTPVSKKPPPKLLLRIYGPQVEHLIDRENELGILRRLARKKIGPRLLGTFKNGRFEEYFASTTLTSADLRVPETSKQIAKRMRELHEGIDLLPHEREEGPFVWINWDKWVERCEKVISFLDAQITSGKAASKKGDAWKKYGFICGVEWPVFRAMVDKYRKFVVDHYGGHGKVGEHLLFAHNDTQYGNILRLKPSGESPLLLPANSHKQLVVIDFEYASANTVGLEFANHFTEWCYNYHDEVAPHACNDKNYPTPEEQHRFIMSYLNHRPQFNPRASATPKQSASEGPRGGVKEFMLDSRTPSGMSDTYKEDEEKRIKAAEEKAKNLMAEVRLWRIANSAQWVAWGIVQAKVDGLDDDESSIASTTEAIKPALPTASSDKLSPESQEKADQHLHDHRPEGLVAEALAHGGDKDPQMIKEAEKAEAEDDEDEFDYLGYSHQRAMFFWGDCVEMGLIKAEDLPERLRSEMKVVPY